LKAIAYNFYDCKNSQFSPVACDRQINARLLLSRFFTAAKGQDSATRSKRLTAATSRNGQVSSFELLARRLLGIDSSN
jgi:hypothetical protein